MVTALLPSTIQSVPAPPPSAGSDPQGGRFHLLTGEADWRTCPEPEPSWEDRTVLLRHPDHPPSHFEFDADTGSLRLAQREAVARHLTPSEMRRPDQRRGADRDRYGSWYWISDDARGIVRLAPGASAAQPWWSLDDFVGAYTDGSCATGERATASFASVPGPPPDPTVQLSGLAITTGHRLVVGLDDDQGGLVLFDLHRRGVARVLRWPNDLAVTPFDLAATADGGMLVLDRTRRTWWRFDRGWRLRADVAPGRPPAFQPIDGSAATCTPRDEVEIIAWPNQLDASGPNAVADPVAIAEGPGVVLVLDRPQAGPSAVVVCNPAGVVARLPVTVRALDPARPDLPSFEHAVAGQDLAWGPAGATRPLPGPLLYVADASTSDTEGYRLELDPPALVHQPDELPMRSWRGRAIVAVAGDVYYDAVGRWVPLEPFGVCNHERDGTLRTPNRFGVDPVPGQPFDSGTPGCVWHRLFIDASIPEGCAVSVGARARDDAEMLDRLPFVPQPTPYLRGAGAELPWYEPWSDVAVRPASPRTGTYELLFQHVIGRYVQIELTFSGTGRTTPSLRALRAWYPRFSYVRAYLPEVYQEEDEPARFVERMLANMEGLLTEQEQRIDHAWMVVDARTAPVTALDWLASWVGLRLEPSWPPDRRRFLLRHVDRLYRMRGTIGGLRSLLRLYLGCSLDEGVVFAPQPRTDDPARIVDRVAPHRFRVLIPARLDADQAAMVGRLVEAARPAHAAFEVRWFSGLLIVGESQLGVDSVVGESLRFEPIVLDRTALATGVLAANHPFDIADRIVSDRDRLGDLPTL